MKKNILIIDDDKLVLNSIGKLLKKEGYEIDCVLSGKEAIEIAHNKVFDLIIVDIKMPGLNGIETIKIIRNIYKKKQINIPEIIITGYASEETKKEADKLGIVEYIYKPFEISFFMEVIKKNLKQ